MPPVTHVILSQFLNGQPPRVGHGPKHPYIKKADKPSFPMICPLWLPRNSEMLNIWWDFRKVAEFIDLNRGWLLPLLDKVKG